MKTIKQVLIIALVLLFLGQAATYFYLGSSDRKIPPKITCPSGVLEVSSKDSEAALLQGIVATDPQDGDLTSRVIISGISKLISNDTAKVTYLVFDSDDNMATCVRKIRYTDYHRPTFDILEPLVFSTTETVALLPMLQATDVRDGDISHQIRVSTLEPTKDSTLYYVSIQVTNSGGDTSWLRVPVLLLETDPVRPSITLNKQLIYLEKGSAFDPEAYLETVYVPGAQVSKSDVTITGDVDTSTSDTYYVHYTYTANGSIGTAILTVVVQ